MDLEFHVKKCWINAIKWTIGMQIICLGIWLRKLRCPLFCLDWLKLTSHCPFDSWLTNWLLRFRKVSAFQSYPHYVFFLTSSMWSPIFLPRCLYYIPCFPLLPLHPTYLKKSQDVIGKEQEILFLDWNPPYKTMLMS